MSRSASEDDANNYAGDSDAEVDTSETMEASETTETTAAAAGSDTEEDMNEEEKDDEEEEDEAEASQEDMDDDEEQTESTSDMPSGSPVPRGSQGESDCFEEKQIMARDEDEDDDEAMDVDPSDEKAAKRRRTSGSAVAMSQSLRNFDTDKNARLQSILDDGYDLNSTNSSHDLLDSSHQKSKIDIRPVGRRRAMTTSRARNHSDYYVDDLWARPTKYDSDDEEDKAAAETSHVPSRPGGPAGMPRMGFGLPPMGGMGGASLLKGLKSAGGQGGLRSTGGGTTKSADTAIATAAASLGSNNRFSIKNKTKSPAIAITGGTGGSGSSSKFGAKKSPDASTSTSPISGFTSKFGSTKGQKSTDSSTSTSPKFGGRFSQKRESLDEPKSPAGKSPKEGHSFRFGKRESIDEPKSPGKSPKEGHGFRFGKRESVDKSSKDGHGFKTGKRESIDEPKSPSKGNGFKFGKRESIDEPKSPSKGNGFKFGRKGSNEDSKETKPACGSPFGAVKLRSSGGTTKIPTEESQAPKTNSPFGARLRSGTSAAAFGRGAEAPSSPKDMFGPRVRRGEASTPATNSSATPNTSSAFSKFGVKPRGSVTGSKGHNSSGSDDTQSENDSKPRFGKPSDIKKNALGSNDTSTSEAKKSTFSSTANKSPVPSSPVSQSRFFKEDQAGSGANDIPEWKRKLRAKNSNPSAAAEAKKEEVHEFQRFALRKTGAAAK